MIKTAKYYCRLNDNPLIEIKEPQINVYVRLQNTCNANCNFCEFCGEPKKFNEDKFKKLLTKIYKIYKINKLSFTGGEPTLDFSLFKRMLGFVNELDKNIFTVVNTNGLHLNELATLNLNSVALSRHHYNDGINQSIFKTKIPTTKDIADYIKKQELLYGKSNLHLSCNLQKDYIGNKEEVKNYLTWCSLQEVTDVGFVGLMNVNEYCKKQFVDYDILKIPDKKILQTKHYSKEENQKVTCKCANYIFAGENLVNFYCRYYVCNNTENVLVYDIDTFKNGFSGNSIDKWIEKED